MVDEVEEKVRDGNSCYDWRRGRREIEKFRDMSLTCEITSGRIKLGMLKFTSELLSEIREGQKPDPFLLPS